MARKQNTETVPKEGRGRPSLLSSLQPVDSTPFRQPASPVFIWATLLLVWLISFLPWRLWQPAPDILLLVIAFWCLNEPHRVSMVTAFVFGLFMDVHDAGLLGERALAYTLVAYGTIILARRLQRFGAVVQAIHLLPVFVLSEAASRIIHAWLAGEWAGWQWLWSALFTVALWPVVDALLHMPQRRLNETDPGSV
ncbi:MAG: rod shape-determining protein MreD [Paralcaligenes sp.]